MVGADGVVAEVAARADAFPAAAAALALPLLPSDCRFEDDRRLRQRREPRRQQWLRRLAVGAPGDTGVVVRGADEEDVELLEVRRRARACHCRLQRHRRRGVLQPLARALVPPLRAAAAAPGSYTSDSEEQQLRNHGASSGQEVRSPRIATTPDSTL